MGGKQHEDTLPFTKINHDKIQLETIKHAHFINITTQFPFIITSDRMNLIASKIVKIFKDGEIFKLKKEKEKINTTLIKNTLLLLL